MRGPHIETSRLLLRPLELEDVSQAYVDWLNDPRVNQFLETRHRVQTLESCVDFVAKSNDSACEHLFGVFSGQTGKHIGNAKLGQVNHEHGRGQISLVIGEREEWGKGLGREIVQALTCYGFRDLGLERLEAGCYDSNLASLRTFLSVGYVVEGFFRSHVMAGDRRRRGCFWMGILPHEFKPA